MSKWPQFGDPVENTAASPHNPLQRGLFVRRVRRTGRLNPGTWWELTDAKGEFWMVNPASCVEVEGLHDRG